MQRSAARVLVDQLIANGVERTYCVPGESFLAVIDAFSDVQDRIDLVVCRHEGGAAVMAEATARLTGRAGVCFVTRGPGATNASIAVHTAQQDSTPLVLFVGQVGTDFIGREAFQEVDYRSFFGSMAKWVVSVDRADRMGELVAHALQVAQSGRPGPVVVALPEDVLTQMVDMRDPGPAQPVAGGAAEEDVTAAHALLASASRPLVLLGGRSWDAATISAWRQAAEAAALPVACAFRYQDLYPNDASNYIGDVGIGINPKLAERLRAADVLIAIGPLLGEMTTSGYTLIEHPRPVQQLVHVHAGAESLGRVYQAARLVNCQPARFARALAARIERDRLPSGRWAADTAASRAAYETWQRPRAQPGGVNMGEVILALRARLRDDAIVCNGAGNFATPVHRFFRYRRWPTQLAPTSGAMGYGIPAGVAAKLQFPERQVVVVAGDGDFMMTAQELATAAQYRAGIVVLIVNNGMYGTIRMHQEREFPERVFGTELANPDFVLMGQAYGMHAERVTQTASFDAALERALASARGALIELVIDPQAITPGATIDEIRAQARQRRVR